MTPDMLAAHFQQAFASLDPSRPTPVETLYDPDVVFIDPFHRIEGRDALGRYFDRLNRNVASCTFDFHAVTTSPSDVVLTWTMTLQLRRGVRRPIVLPGATHLRVGASGASLHQDYFDAGAMIYEQIPVLGSLLRLIKRSF